MMIIRFITLLLVLVWISVIWFRVTLDETPQGDILIWYGNEEKRNYVRVWRSK